MAGVKDSHVQQNLQNYRSTNVVNLITCWSKNKHEESARGKILIDDRADLGIRWVEKGGIFIHHTSTVTTLVRLRELGLIG